MAVFQCHLYQQFLMSMLLYRPPFLMLLALIRYRHAEGECNHIRKSFCGQRDPGYSDTLIDRQKKTRKNCECCPVSLLIVRQQRLSNIQVLNCQTCNQCPKCHKSPGLSLSLWPGHGRVIKQKNKSISDQNWTIWTQIE